MDAKFIKCKRGGVETIYTTMMRNGVPEECIRESDIDPVYLKLYTDDILNFKIRSTYIMAEVVASVGKLPLVAWDYTVQEGVSERMRPIIIISTSDTDSVEMFGELVGIPDLCSEVLKVNVKD